MDNSAPNLKKEDNCRHGNCQDDSITKCESGAPFFAVVVDKIFEIIERISKEGVTIFLVEQNAKRALQTAGRAYVMETGGILLAESAEVLLKDPNVKKAYLGL